MMKGLFTGWTVLWLVLGLTGLSVWATDTADIEIPLALTGPNFTIGSDYIFGFDATAADAGDGYDDFDSPLLPVFFGDTAGFYANATSLFTKDIRPTPAGGVAVPFELRIHLDSPDYQVATTHGLYFDDANGNGVYDDGEDIWADAAAGSPGVYDDGVDTQVYAGTDNSWTATNGTPGYADGLFFNDLNGDGGYSTGEDIWRDTANPTAGTGSYTTGDEQVYNGGDGWETADQTAGTAAHTVLIRWDPSAAVWATNNLKASIKDKTTGTVLVADMTTGNGYLVVTADQTLLISLSIGAVTNSQPTAVADSATTSKNVALTGTTALDVLANDYDADSGDTLSLVRVGADDGSDDTTATAQGGTATIVAGKVTYTPPVDYESDINNPATYDTFTYTITDGTDTATATVTIVVFSGEAVSVRSHANRMIPSDGLVVTVTLHFLNATIPGTLTKLELTEVFPMSNDASSIYQIAAGAGIGGLDIAGENPPDLAVTGNGTQRAVTFSWDTGALPAQDAISFTYRLTGPAADADAGQEKSFCAEGDLSDLQCGVLTYRLNTQAAEDPDKEAFTTGDHTFLPVSQLYHSADYNQDWQIDLFELLRVLALYNHGLYYEVDPTHASVDGYRPYTGEGASTVPENQRHSADYQSPFGQIDLFEVLRVLALYNHGLYYAPNLEQATNPTADGYVPATVAPSR